MPRWSKHIPKVPKMLVVTIKAEYVSTADPIEKSSDRKEKNAGENDSETN